MTDDTRTREDLLSELLTLRQRIAELEALETTSKSESRLKELQSLAYIGAWELDLVNNTLFWSDEIYRIFEIDPSEFGASYEAFLSCVHPEDREAVNQAYSDSLLKKKPYEIIHRLKFKDARIKYVHERCATFYDEQGKPLRSVGTVQDITDRKEAEEALRRSEERLELALQAGNLGWWDFHVPTAQTFTNERAVGIVGYSLNEIGNGMNFWESILHPDDRQRVLEHLKDRLAGLIDSSEIEYRVRHKNGDWRWVLSRGETTERDPDGNVLRMTGTFLDITERKSAELQAAESNELREKIFSDSPTGIAVYRADGKCVSANEALGRIVGADVERLLRQNFRNLASWRDSGLLAEADRVLAEGINIQREFQVTTTFGKSLWVDARLARLTSGGEPHLLLVFNDITDRKEAEEALRKSEALLNSIIEQSPFSMFISDNEGTLIKINPACKKWVRVTDEDVVGKYSLLKDEAIEAQGLMPLVRRVFENGEQVNFELVWDSALIKHLGHKEAFKLILSVTIFPVKDAEGRITNAVCQHIDITERKEVQERLRESEEQYRAVFDNAGIGIDLLDRDGGIVKMNQALLNILGRSEDELRGITFLDITHPDDREISKRRLEALLRGEIDSYRLEKRYVREDGSIVWVDLWSSPIRDAKGKHVGTVGVIEDITERKKAEQALREGEARYRLLVENVNDAIFVAQDGFVKSPNYRLALMTGYSLDELTELPFARFIHPEDADMVLNRHRRRVNGASEPTSEYQFRLMRKDGNPLWVELSVTLIDWEGRPATLNVLRDVTERVQAEEALRQSEIRYRGLFDNMSDAVAVYKAAGDGEDFLFVDFNKSGEQIEGVKKQELLGKSVQGVFPGVKELGLFQVFQRVWRTGVPEHRPVGLYKDERLEGWRENFVYRLPSGEIVVVYSDETERERAKQILDAEKRRFEALAESSPFGLAMIRQDGSFEYTNPKFHEMFGYDLSEIPTGREWFRKAFPDPDYRHEVTAAWFEDLAKATQDQLRPRTFTVKCQDGAQKIIHFRPILLPSGDHVVTYEDITQRKMAEEALQESEEKYRTLFEDSLDALFMVTEDGTLVDANKAYFDLFGYEKEEILGRSVIMVYADPADRPRYHEALLAKGFVKDYPLRLVRKDGRQLDCLLSTRIERDKTGKFLVSRGFIRDITEQKNLQRQLLRAQKMEAIGTLAGGIAHDFNNLLTIAQGFSELLLAEKDREHPDYADLQKIAHAARNGAELVQRLLMFSRKAEPKLVPMNLNKQVLQVEKLLRRTIPKMIDIKLELSADLPGINADPSQVEQVLMNLAVNARDAMPDAGKLIVKTDSVTLDEEYCRFHVDAGTGQHVVLEVSDTGCGMDKQTIEHIFEPFFTTKEMGRGTGLGLAMVYGIVAQHDGHITVYSEVGKGTIFKVYFPAIPTEEEPRAADSGIMVASGTETVLLVDDEEFVRELGSRILTRKGYTVLQAVNGKDGLDVFKKEGSRISLVILDLIMPEMGGAEFLKELLKIDPKVKVLIASGFSADASMKQTIQMGAKGFVSKPFRLQELLREVRRVLDEL